MLLRLDTPFRDAAADDLAWSLRRDEPAAATAGGIAPCSPAEAPRGARAAAPWVPAGLARLDVDAGPFRAALHVLGASHAVELTVDGRRLVEVVACGAPDGRPLELAPGELAVGDGRRYRFEAEILRRRPADVAALADRLRDRIGGDRHGLVGEFPGAPGALTALRAWRAGRDGVAWETWHLYPERGEVVRTTTAVGAPVEVAA